MLNQKLSEKEIHAIIGDAVKIESKFITESIPVALIGMNSTLMIQYIKFVADRLIVELGYKKLFKVTNPFNWMETISMTSKTNFFEKRVSEYSKANIMSKLKDPGSSAFRLDAEF